jgi:hypothetical protein
MPDGTSIMLGEGGRVQTRTAIPGSRAKEQLSPSETDEMTGKSSLSCSTPNASGVTLAIVRIGVLTASLPLI